MHLGSGVPTAIVQLPADQLPVRIPVGTTYDRALIILRYQGQPVTKIDLPAVNGEVDPAAFARALFIEVRRNARWWWLREYLGPEPLVQPPEATVAICTRDRPDDLRRALIAVRALDPAPREVLVIDNDPSSTRTCEVVSGFDGVRYVREDQRGLDRARNRALREARTDLVAFTDDDAVPEPSWLAALLQPFADRRVWCTTGLTLPLELETPAQEWFERYSPFGRGFRRRVLDGMRDNSLAVGAAGAGANMAVRRAVLADLGGFDEALDAGTPTRSGGDHEMFGRILAAGYRIVYEPAAVSWHRHRRTWPELRETLHGYGVGVFAMWTRRLLRERDLGVVAQAARWIRRHHLPTLWRAIRRRPDAVPLELIRAEITGCFAGPAAYARSELDRRRRAAS